MLKNVLIPIHRAGWPFVGGALVAALALALIWPAATWVGLLAAGFCAFFFRDPERITPARAGLVVSPADGLVSAITQAPPPRELELGAAPLSRVSIFLSVFDVHVNRIPVDGAIAGLSYHKGRFLNASNDKASEENERQSVRVTMADGRDIVVVQIAGLIARRIVCDLNLDQAVLGGERFGLIRFGSRCDVYLPEGVTPLVAPGQRMIGGETVIADLNGDQDPRPGEVR